MTFSTDQIEALKAPLARDHVKSRSQAGRQLSYIEGWVAIAEANRIFGFDGWDRELSCLKQLGDPREVDGKWRVAYMATVRIRVPTEGKDFHREVLRDGTGYGSGIDRDLGQAHESAIKEAETDAMKRALMTFGNPFGLALYDKEQRNVADDRAPVRQEAPRPQPQLVQPNPADEEDRRAYMALARSAILNAEYASDLDQWWRGQGGKRREYGIVQGTPEYAELARLAGEAKAKLPADITAAG
jgi:DNA repair and recombination protein RAD52